MGLLSSLAADKYDRQYSDGYLDGSQPASPHKRRLASVLALVIIYAAIGAATPLIISTAVWRSKTTTAATR
ncbi:MAG: hypothetical protein LC121_23135 [Anaerolineae bacterium]|nr:hypothetical protein [Anaerolineae bacterium]